MVGQASGMNLNGQIGLYMSVFSSKLNGNIYVDRSTMQITLKPFGRWKLSEIGFRWYAKRFLHPDILAPYDYIFIWDEDLGLEDFDAER